MAEGNVIQKVTVEAFNALAERVKALEEAQTKSRGAASTREMTDADAENILNGELKGTSHRDSAEKLGLSYGQVYSCRLEYTFKHIHKKLKDAGWKNPWVK